MRKRPDSDRPPAECANCGAMIPAGARACPECGADERTGWREASIYDGLDLPDDAFADESAPRQDDRRIPRKHEVHGVPWYWWYAGIGLLAVLILGALALL